LKGEEIMSKPEERIAALPSAFRWRPGPITDPIGMEFFLEDLEPNLRTQLIATRLDTVAAVYRNIADGAAKAAKIVSGAGRG
jgi:hypothetical protein